MVTLTANPDLIIVDLNQNPTGTTVIEYKNKRASDVVWHRIGPSPTNKWVEAIDTQSLPADEEKNAEINFKFESQPISPGEVYQVKIMREGANPNRTLPEGVEAEVDIPCLRKEPQVRQFITDQNGPEVGGTFVWHKIFTKEPTLKRLSVSTSQPRQSNGILKFREVLSATPVPTALTTDQELEVTGLLPGNTHFAIVLVSDKNGNWEQITYEFITLQREVTVRFTKLDITNDGDPMGASDADIHLEILSSSSKNPHGATIRTEKRFDFPVKNINTGDSIKLINTHTIGPERVLGDNRFVLINVRGEEFDGILEPNERAANYFGDALLDLPQGRGREEVSKAAKSVWARPENDDFNFYVHLDYDVKYSSP